MLELTLRLVFSLAVVIGLLLLLAKFGAKRFKAGPDALIQVVQRQALSRTTSVSVITVGTRVLVLGTTEQQVSVLAELDPDELELELDAVDPTGLHPAGLEPSGATYPTPEVVQPTYDVVARSATGNTAGPAGTVARIHPGDVQRGPLTGSVLSPDTWRRTLAAFSQGSAARKAGPHS